MDEVKDMLSAIGAYPKRWCALRLFRPHYLIAVLLLTTACNVSGKEIKQERKFQELLTVGGLLVTSQIEFLDDTWINRIQVGGITIFEDTSTRGFMGIEASYPIQAPAQLILLSLNTNAMACEMYLRVLEVKRDGGHVISNQFGNCWPPADLQRYKMIKVNPIYYDGAWYIALPPTEPELINPARWTKFDWYVYRGGKVTKQTSGPPSSLRH